MSFGLALWLGLAALSPASAGQILFRLGVDGGELTVTNGGDSSAFQPEAFRLLADGHWSPLPPAASAAPSELPPGASFKSLWSNARPPRAAGLESFRILLVRFFDEAGAGSGQLAFLDEPPPAPSRVEARYRDGLLSIRPPSDPSIRATWVLWAQADGIRALAKPVAFEHRQPDARRLAWEPGSRPARLDLGAAEPPATLLHETSDGLVLQHVAAGRGGERRQRAAWLSARRRLFGLASFLALAGLALLAWPQRVSRTAAERQLPFRLDEAAFLVAGGLLVASVLGLVFLNSANWPTGGDAGSHLLYAWLYGGELFWAGSFLPWLPEVFAGLPFLSYYFPLPFVVMAVLAKVIGLAQAFKWGSFLAAMLLPGAVYCAGRRWLGFPRPAACFGALGALAFLLHEQNSIWGGNLLSTLAGEFAYSYGLLFAALAMAAWSRAVHDGRGWWLAVLLEAATGLSHGFPLLIVGFSTAFLLLEALGARDRAAATRRALVLLLGGHVLAFCLLGGWLWPMLEMHGLTIPNDAAFEVSGWRDLLPASLWPVSAGGALGALALASPKVRAAWTPVQTTAARLLAGGAGLAVVAFVAGDRLGLADIRFFPLVWLLGAIVCGWLGGQALAALTAETGQAGRWGRAALVMAAAAGVLGWSGSLVQAAPDWGLWNHSGLEAKPQWSALTRLFPAMRGEPWSPRLVFEHDPDNRDIGSTRSLEALPMFLGGRPVLEGLYMESALLGPAVYQLQSELSARPSSPLVRFPSGSLDPELAAKHMRFLHCDTALLRSAKAKRAVEASGLFEKIGDSPPFALYRLKGFDGALAEEPALPLRVFPSDDWMQNAFAWFRSRKRFEEYLPVYGGGELPAPDSTDRAPVRPKTLSRHELAFEARPGRPVLVKMAYHPRWRLASKGELRVAGPGFMLVVPGEPEIRLVYGLTETGKAGAAATLAAALALAALGLRGRRGRREAEDGGPRRFAYAAAGWALLALSGAALAWSSPERAYRKAWEAMRKDRFDDAGRLFGRAYRLRRPPAKREEALFWLAKSAELAGRRGEAKTRYRELFENYHGYWVPESLYTYALLQELDGDLRAAATARQRLREEHPNNVWTQRLNRP